MAKEANGPFTKRATDRLLSPDDLERYVRVTNPSVWVVLALLIGYLSWGLFARVGERCQGGRWPGRAVDASTMDTHLMLGMRWL